MIAIEIEPHVEHAWSTWSERSADLDAYERRLASLLVATQTGKLSRAEYRDRAGWLMGQTLAHAVALGLPLVEVGQALAQRTQRALASSTPVVLVHPAAPGVSLAPVVAPALAMPPA